MKNTDFQDLYNSWYRRAFAFARSYVQDAMAAEDLVSESIVKLWKMMNEQEIEHPQALLLTILKNKALDYLRRECMLQTIEEDLLDAYHNELSIRISTLEACNPDEVFSAEVKEIIDRTLAGLPELTRIVFEMSRYDGLSVKEIARINNLTPKSIEYHITRSLKALRLALKDYLPVFMFLVG